MHKRNALGQLGRHRFAQHGHRTLRHGLADKRVSVYLRALNGHEEMTRTHLSRVDIHSRYLHFGVAHYV